MILDRERADIDENYILPILTLTVSTPLLKVRFVVTLRPFSKRVDIEVPADVYGCQNWFRFSVMILTRVFHLGSDL